MPGRGKDHHPPIAGKRCSMRKIVLSDEGSGMNRRVVDLWAPAIGASGTVLAYGNWGRPGAGVPVRGRAGR